MPKPPFFTGFEAVLNFRSSPVSRSFLLEAEMLENQAFPPFFLLKNGCIHLNTLEYTTFKPLYLLHSWNFVMRAFIKLPRLAASTNAEL